MNHFQNELRARIAALDAPPPSWVVVKRLVMGGEVYFEKEVSWGGTEEDGRLLARVLKRKAVKTDNEGGRVEGFVEWALVNKSKSREN